MQVRVLLFGVLKDMAGRSSDVLSLPDRACARDVISHYESQFPAMKGSLGSIAISLNQEYVQPAAKLNPGDEIALLPPVSGGADETQAQAAISKSIRATITRDQIETEVVRRRIQRPEDGATVIFEGIVRNHSRGRRTLFLDYEAYEEMALKQLDALAAEACSRFEVRDVAIVHRLGKIEIGETSILIVVASAHRAAAFEACRWLIDTIKRTVPIWKKEHFEDGAVWADGEPFPEHLASGTNSRSPASK